MSSLAALHPLETVRKKHRAICFKKEKSNEYVEATFMAIWLILVACLNTVLFHHGAQLMVRHTQ